jgi:hypothetical protein
VDCRVGDPPPVIVGYIYQPESRVPAIGTGSAELMGNLMIGSAEVRVVYDAQVR